MAARDGSLYVVTIAGDPSPALWRSRDGARTWESVALEVPTGAQDSAVAVTDDGRIWIASLAAAQGGAICTTVSVSEDGGSTFRHNTRACSAPGPTDRPWLASDGTRAHLLQGRPGALEHGATTDNDAWPMRPVPFPGAVPGPLTGGRGSVGFAYTQGFAIGDAPGPLQGTLVAQTRDGGATWATERVSPEASTHRWPVFAADGDVAVAAWLRTRDDAAATLLGPGRSESPGLPWDVRFAQRGEDGWSEAQTLDGGWNAHVWAAASGDHALVTWLHAETQDGAWTLRAWLDGERFETPVLHQGTLERRTYLDFLASALLPDGRAVVVAPDDEGLSAWVFTPAPAG